MEMFTRMELECFLDSTVASGTTTYLLFFGPFITMQGRLATLQRALLSLFPAVFVGRLFEKTEKKMADKHVLLVWYFEYANDGVVYTFERPFWWWELKCSTIWQSQWNAIYRNPVSRLDWKLLKTVNISPLDDDNYRAHFYPTL